jgi:hypothetical protein
MLPDLTAEEEEKVRQIFENPRSRRIPSPSMTGKPTASVKKFDATSLGVRIKPK